jgi:hypothetical protein
LIAFVAHTRLLLFEAANTEEKYVDARTGPATRLRLRERGTDAALLVLVRPFQKSEARLADRLGSRENISRAALLRCV